MPRGKIVTGSDNLLILEDLRDELEVLKGNEGWVTSGTVQARLFDSAGQEVEGQTWPVAMSYVAGSSATWVATLEDGLSLTAGAGYRAVVDVDAGQDRVRRFTLDVLAVSK